MSSFDFVDLSLEAGAMEKETLKSREVKEVMLCCLFIKDAPRRVFRTFAAVSPADAVLKAAMLAGQPCVNILTTLKTVWPPVNWLPAHIESRTRDQSVHAAAFLMIDFQTTLPYSNND